MGKAIVLEKPFLGTPPKPPLDVHGSLANGEALLKVHPQVTVGVKYQAVVAIKLVIIDDRPPVGLFDRQLQRGGCRDIDKDSHVDIPVTLQKALQRGFAETP